VSESAQKPIRCFVIHSVLSDFVYPSGMGAIRAHAFVRRVTNSDFGFRTDTSGEN